MIPNKKPIAIAVLVAAAITLLALPTIVSEGAEVFPTAQTEDLSQQTQTLVEDVTTDLIEIGKAYTTCYQTQPTRDPDKTLDDIISTLEELEESNLGILADAALAMKTARANAWAQATS